MVAHIDNYRKQNSLIPQVLPPCSVEAEDAILGGLIFDPSALARVENTIFPEAFYVKANQEIYRSILRVTKRGDVADLMQVSIDLQDRKKMDSVGGMVKLTNLLSTTISATNIDSYAKIVLEKWTRRQLISSGHDLVEISHDQAWDADHLFEFVDRIYERITKYKVAITPGADQEFANYQKLIAQVKEIEQTEADPGYQLYKLNRLAEKTGYSVQKLRHLYLKYLCAAENEPAMTLDELKAKYGSNVQEWYLHGFGPKGSVVLLHAHGGCGKTRLVYDWIWSLVNGEPWEGFQVTAERRRVLIVQTDESQGDMLSTLDSRGFTSDMPIRVKTRWTADHMAALRRDVEEFKPDVILVDSLTSINQNSLFSENDTEYARPILELRDLAQEFGSLIYLIHHSNSEGNSRGTKAITASVSHVFNMSFPKDESDPRSPKRHLTIQKSRARAPEKYELEFDPDTGGWSLLGVCDDREDKFTTEGPLRKQIMDILIAHRNVPLTSQEVTAMTGHNANTVRKILSDLGSHGEISRKKNGKHYCYWLADDGSDKSLLSFDSVLCASTVTPYASDCDSLINKCKNSQETPRISSGSVADQLWINHGSVEGSVVENSHSPYPETDTAAACGKLLEGGSVSHLSVNEKNLENFSDPSDQLSEKNGCNPEPVKDCPTDPLTDPSLIPIDPPRISQDHQTNPVPNNSPSHKASTVNDFKKGDVVRIIEDSRWDTLNQTGWVSYVYPEEIEVTYYGNQKRAKRLYFPNQLEVME